MTIEMFCRCGHRAGVHRPTKRGMAYASEQRRNGRMYAVKRPCTDLICPCRDWKFDPNSQPLCAPEALCDSCRYHASHASALADIDADCACECAITVASYR